MIHGKADPLVRPSGGRATARAIPGARLLLLDGMGHDLPRALWPRLIDAIAEHARAADTVARAGSRVGAGSPAAVADPTQAGATA